mmetsp:Transcript_70756/g.197425  ORF Transcript_70756/g.197425 Transcript_70756/m.197425 type:complete len:221 (+) Transcript_70756:429-1091(+)
MLRIPIGHQAFLLDALDDDAAFVVDGELPAHGLEGGHVRCRLGESKTDLLRRGGVLAGRRRLLRGRLLGGRRLRLRLHGPPDGEPQRPVERQGHAADRLDLIQGLGDSGVLTLQTVDLDDLVSLPDHRVWVCLVPLGHGALLPDLADQHLLRRRRGIQLPTQDCSRGASDARSWERELDNKLCRLLLPWPQDVHGEELLRRRVQGASVPDQPPESLDEIS